jgi:hypothetical protein
VGEKSGVALPQEVHRVMEEEIPTGRGSFSIRGQGSGGNRRTASRAHRRTPAADHGCSPQAVVTTVVQVNVTDRRLSKRDAIGYP